MTKKSTKTLRFKVLFRITSIQHGGQVFEAGEYVEFDNSEEASYKPNFERLVAAGVLEPYNGEWPVPTPPEETPNEEVTNAPN